MSFFRFSCFIVPIFLTSTLFSQCVKTGTGLKMEKDGKTLWEFVIDNPEGKPFIHPLNMPNGSCITDARPKDHPWHMGLWFCWKYINKVNYWEPGKRMGVKPKGETYITARDIKIEKEAATVKLNLAYRPRSAKDKSPLLTEERVIVFSAPDKKGSYTVTSTHHFIAQKDVVLDRTPPRISGGKRTSGGYAGFSLRMASLMNKFTKTSSCGERKQIEIVKKERNWIGYTSADKKHGVRITLLKGTPETRFYNWADNRFANPCPVYTRPIRVKAGESLDLSYQVKVY